ncbi:hypothetical protein KAS50_01315 [bacterium]|nr:hypothetical protein [bacterium]
MDDQRQQNGEKSIADSAGLVFIFEILEQIFVYMVKRFKFDESAKEDIAIEILSRRIKEGRRLVKKGKEIVSDVQEDLNGLNQLLNNIPFLDTSFRKAQDSLKDASNVAEEATLKIQDASMEIQESLDKISENLSKLAAMEISGDDKKEILKSSTDEINSIADTTFNIMTALQFQDILRQQLSAIGSILTKTKSKIEKSMEKIEGTAVEAEEAEDYFVPTDDSVLGKQQGQDEIDLIISSVKGKKDDE